MTFRAVILAILLVFASWIALQVTAESPLFSSGARHKAEIETPERMAEAASVPNTVPGWPPRVGEHFPAVALTDHEGKPFDLQSLRGKPVLLEFVAMTCAACEAWSGGHTYGAYHDLLAQHGLDSIESYYHRYTGGLNLFDGSVNFVQLIVYDIGLKAPSTAELAEWRAHFHFNEHPNVFIVTGGEPLRNRDSFFRIPGFLLLDKDGVIRFDALGHSPQHDLFRELLPAVKGMR